MWVGFARNHDFSFLGRKMLSGPETPGISPDTPGFCHSGQNSGHSPGNSGFGNPDLNPDIPVLQSCERWVVWLVVFVIG